MVEKPTSIFTKNVKNRKKARGGGRNFGGAADRVPSPRHNKLWVKKTIGVGIFELDSKVRARLFPKVIFELNSPFSRYPVLNLNSGFAKSLI